MRSPGPGRRRGRRPALRLSPRREGGRPLGRARQGQRPALRPGHPHHHHVVHQGRDGGGGPSPRRARADRLRGAGRRLLAGVRRRREGRRPHLASDEPFGRPAGRRPRKRRHRGRHAAPRAPRAGAGGDGAGMDAGRLVPLPPDHLRLAAGRVVRRVSGKRVPSCSPRRSPGRSASTFWIGLPEAEEPRVAPHFSPTPGLDTDQLDRAAGRHGHRHDHAPRQGGAATRSSTPAS